VLRHSLLRWIRRIRPQDFVWLLLFSGLIATTKHGDAFEIVPLVLLGIAQVLEPKIPAVATTRNRIFWIVVKLVLGWVLIGFTDGVNSPFWLVLLLPVATAATTFGIGGTLVFILLSSGAYLTFVVFVEKPSQITVDLGLRIIFIAVVGNLANILAEELRAQSRKHQLTAEQLANANKQIQQAEEAVRRSDRLAALGQLSAGLAHELRNPLGTIRASSEMLARNVSAENEVAREMAGFIAAEVDRCNSLITRFLQFARPLQLKAATADLSHTIDHAVEMVQREIPGIAIYKNYEPEIRPFPFDAELMERVFYNLLLNAAQASSPGGAVTVKTRAAGGAAEIAVIDRGVGIGPEQIDNVFNPFFTTKPDGVGLGLAIVSKIVDEHGGKITVDSEPGKGSVFRVLLPTVPAAEDGS
jgi:two-component system, NtrC family, sensor histidine kinase HydH